MKRKKHRLILSCLLACALCASALVAACPTARAEETTGDWDQTVFFGESTTAHLARVGGVLDTPSGRLRVWRDKSGTRMLSRRILASSVELPASDGSTRTLTLVEALREFQPPVMVLSFGLNGIMGFITDEASFVGAYETLIDGITKHSPRTRIVLQSVYPVRRADGYSVDVDTLNAHIDTLNACIRNLAQKKGVEYIDTAHLLKDTDGRLLEKYDCGDGIHLRNEAYQRILVYLQRQLKGE
ncbi:MAG: SGNH/GDSL hydrolase family protein [Clostridia bacterium]|nr:SGNH/GDSL hydrolase family protein [Clostridia bacterium]MBQ9774368.1 SGNH/GDSL hydrolase family protein [Clostridia bacterium]